MARSLKIYGAVIPGNIGGRKHKKAKAIHKAKKAHHKHAKHVKGGPTQTWGEAMKTAGLSL